MLRERAVGGAMSLVSLLLLNHSYPLFNYCNLVHRGLIWTTL